MGHLKSRVLLLRGKIPTTNPPQTDPERSFAGQGKGRKGEVRR